jgi:hypothetical protein
MTIYVSARDIRPLVKREDENPLGYTLTLVHAATGEVVKRFTSEARRDAYLARNGYTES